MHAVYNKEYLITAEMVKNFGLATTDMNPIHFNKEYAASTIFKEPIVHGMLVAGIISASMTDYFGLGTIYLSQELKFKAPVKYNDTVTVIFSDETVLTKHTIKNQTSVFVTVKVGETVVVTGEGMVIPGKD